MQINKKDLKECCEKLYRHFTANKSFQSLQSGGIDNLIKQYGPENVKYNLIKLQEADFITVKIVVFHLNRIIDIVDPELFKQNISTKFYNNTIVNFNSKNLTIQKIYKINRNTLNASVLLLGVF